MPGEASIVPMSNISVVSLPQLSAALKLRDLYNNMIGIIVLVVMVSGFRFSARLTGSPADAPCYPVDRICTFDRWSRQRGANRKEFMCHVLKDCRDRVFIFVTHMFNVIIFGNVWQHGALLKLTIFDSLTFCHNFLHFVTQSPTF